MKEEKLYELWRKTSEPSFPIWYTKFQSGTNLSKEELKAKLSDGYWICSKCAFGNGAKTDGGCHTCSSQLCTICEKEVICNAISDWVWDKELEQSYIWD